MTPSLNRRDFLQATVATTALAAASGTVHATARTNLLKGPTDKVTLAASALEPGSTSD
jgi:tellurite resistance protein